LRIDRHPDGGDDSHGTACGQADRGFSSGLLPGEPLSRWRQGGELHWILEPKVSLEGKTVLLVDDIYDEGITLANVISALLDRGASHVVSAVLIKKRHDRANVHFSPDIVGLEVDDHYVFGCGMDYQHHWRHLPAIYALTDE
jgi:hypoxanthine phosphoribosyltransferase